MTATVWLVPHTHWDREWYEPFQRFRLRLVDLMDDVVARAEREPDFRFTMDGQMAAVDDYLEVRPDRGRPRARRPGPARDRPLARPHGRVPLLGRDDDPQPRDGLGRRLPPRRGDADRLPARHVRPLRADAPAAAARRHRAGRRLS